MVLKALLLGIFFIVVFLWDYFILDNLKTLADKIVHGVFFILAIIYSFGYTFDKDLPSANDLTSWAAYVYKFFIALLS